MRATRSHRDNRRSHHALDAARLSKCPDCGSPHLRHRACLTCGKYRGKMVVDVKAAIVKKDIKKSKKAAK